jgi:hypothetical protein
MFKKSGKKSQNILLCSHIKFAARIFVSGFGQFLANNLRPTLFFFIKMASLLPRFKTKSQNKWSILSRLHEWAGRIFKYILVRNYNNTNLANEPTIQFLMMSIC